MPTDVFHGKPFIILHSQGCLLSRDDVGLQWPNNTMVALLTKQPGLTKTCFSTLKGFLLSSSVQNAIRESGQGSLCYSSSKTHNLGKTLIEDVT